MATVSAFGFGGTDHLNTFFENEVSAHYARDMARWNALLQREMSTWQWKNEPKLRREGLEDAGLNPLLAVGSLGGSSALSASEAAPPVFEGGDTNLGDVDSWQFGKKKKAATSALDATTAENEATEASARLEKLKAEIEKEALEDYEVDSYDGKGKLLNPTRRAMRESIRNAVNKSEYENNWTRSLISDVVGSLLGLSSAFSNSASGASSIRNSSSNDRSSRNIVIPRGGRLIRLGR